MTASSAYRSVDPTSGALLAAPEALDPAAARPALDALEAAAARWAAVPLPARVDAVRALGAALLAEAPRLADQMAAELGKRLAEGRAEVQKAAALCEAIVEIAPGALRTVYQRLEGVDAWVRPVPRGVVLGVMPANYPIWQALRCLAPNLAVGNGALIKPAPAAALSSAALRGPLRAAGLDGPAAVLLLSEAATRAAIAHPAIQGVVVVGGPVAGAAIGAAAGAARKKVVLELGGNDAYVVLDDADLELAAEVIVQSRLKNAGQACLSAKRVIVTAGAHEALRAAILRRVDAVVVGDPRDPRVGLGPLISPAARDRLHAQVEASVAAGARRLRGGHPLPGPGAFYALTVLDAVPPGAPAARDELFGPVLSLQVAADEAEALRLADDTDYGLGAALFSTRGAEALALAAQLRAGTVALNGPATSDPRLPFGGLRGSGHGVELGEAGLLEFTARQVLRAPRDAVEPLRLDRMGWHFVHPAPVVDALRSASEADLSDYDQSDALALREELAAALEVAPGALTLTHGGEDALLKLLLLERAAGRPLLLPALSWPAYAEMARGLGLDVVELPVRIEHSAGGGRRAAVALADWAPALDAHPDGLLLVGSPNNPTGHALPDAVLEPLAARCGARLLIDGVYQPLQSPLLRLCGAADARCPRLIGSMSTLFGLPGLRVGFVVGALPPALTLSLGLSPAALRTCRAALRHRGRYGADRQAAVDAARRIGARAGRRWRAWETDAPFVMIELDADVSEAELEVAAARAGARPAALRLTGPGGPLWALRFTLGPPEAEAAIERYLRALDAGGA